MRMELFDNDLALKDWDSFFGGNKTNCRYIRKEILDSWHRSQSYGINPFTYKLQEPEFDKGFDIYNNDWIYGQKLTFRHLEYFYELLRDTDCAIFYISQELIIVSQRGSEELLAQLNSLNIGIGTDLNERYAGTNAAVLAATNHSLAYVAGAEHFVKAFHEFACIVTPYRRISSKYTNYTGYIMFISRIEYFNFYQLPVIKQFGDLLTSSALFRLEQIKSKLLYAYLDKGLRLKDQNGLIFVDHRNIILHHNGYWQKHQLISENVNGCDFTSLFPELSSATDCMRSGKQITLQEVSFNRKSIILTYFMDATPIYENDACIGMVVSLQEKSRVHNTITKLAGYNAHYTKNSIIGNSSLMESAKESITLAAESPSNVLIIGETGTGKELFAHAIHNASNRSLHPFVSINCAAIPHDLIGSELFGYVEGAFTGSRKGGAIGKFELADKGTIFLDEIGDMPLDMQSTLLRVLEEKSFNRIGGNQRIPIDVKIIAATNKDLRLLIEKNEFRMDLYYRLNVIKIDVPPLRIRKEDINDLVRFFIKEYSKLLNKNIIGITQEAMNILINHNWPGNVRELRNTIERAVNHCSSSMLSSSDLSIELQASINNFEKNSTFELPTTISETFNSLERDKILSLMVKYNGNKSQVAKEMGISRSTLYKKLDNLNY